MCSLRAFVRALAGHGRGCEKVESGLEKRVRHEEIEGLEKLESVERWERREGREGWEGQEDKKAEGRSLAPPHLLDAVGCCWHAPSSRQPVPSDPCTSPCHLILAPTPAI